MNILLYTFAGAVLLAFAVYAAGAALPETHTAAVSASYSAPPEQLWKAITDPAKFPEWRTGLTKVDVRDGLITEHSSFGVMTYRFVDAEPPRRITTNMVNGKELGFEGNWTFELTPEGTGSRLTITEHGRVFHPVFRVMAKYIFGHEKTLRGYHADLARRLSR